MLIIGFTIVEPGEIFKMEVFRRLAKDSMISVFANTVLHKRVMSRWLDPGKHFQNKGYHKARKHNFEVGFANTVFRKKVMLVTF